MFLTLPGNFNPSIVSHIKYLTQLHKEVYTNFTKSVISEAVTLKHPIIRPMWWVESENLTFVANNDQFLVGNSLLVAPILSPASDDTGKVSRVVLIPRGRWVCVSQYCSTLDKQGVPRTL